MEEEIEASKEVEKMGENEVRAAVEGSIEHRAVSGEVFVRVITFARIS